ncbi:hypothetical protein FKP32DRAFT_1673002 [Trametes sanguinea]|nr:hypothetical protein FKP32DRAFT_1673002 [Trametes sanguinea]
MSTTTSPVYNVPMALDKDLLRTAGLKPFLAENQSETHLRNTRECTVGPMPADMFLDEFLPLNPGSQDRSDQLSSAKAFDAIPSHADEPAGVYTPLVAALNDKTELKSRCPGFIFKQTMEHSTRPYRRGYTRPHICCFTPANLDRVKAAHHGSPVELGYAEFFIQTTSQHTLDYFVDPDAEADAATLADHVFIRRYDYVDEEENRALYREIQEKCKTIDQAHGQHISFATEVLARQHRNFLFTISVAGSSARLFRWDRSGCVVTRAFDIHQQPDLLAEFLWRFSNVSDAGRGHDMTVRMASHVEGILFRTTVRQHIASQLDIADDKLDEAVAAHYVPGNVVVIPVDSRRSDASRREHFIVSRPVVSPLTVDGRGTRGYWAVNALTGRIAFLKDTWRSSWSRRDVEGDALGHLNEAGVRNVPSLAIHGDVLDTFTDWSGRITLHYQATRTDAFAQQPWRGRLNKYKRNEHLGQLHHYRLVTHTVGYSLKTMQGTEELLYAGYDVFTAMRDALAKASRIHRDLSANNIILVKEPGHSMRKGYLIDWDASDTVDEKGMAVHAGRVGTWAFLSMRMLEPKLANGHHTFKDDMEALLYVIFYCAVFCTPHNMTKEELIFLHKVFFYDYENAVGVGGGKGKIVNARIRRFTGSFDFDSDTFQEWLNTMLDYLRPSVYDKHKPKNMWEPDKVDEYWAHFLGTHSLEKDDRVFARIVAFYACPR